MGDPVPNGLTDGEAAQLRQAFGLNELPRTGGRTLRRIVGETLREPMFLLLMGAAALYLVLGDLGEGLFLLAGGGAAIALVVLQEARSERALNALRDLAQPHARVIRSGVERRIPSPELVPGDVLLVGEGERIPADGLLVAGEMLSVDESTLTGESAPVTKRLAQDGEAFGDGVRPGGDVSPHLFAGALVVRGQGVARVSRTGSASALGQIGGSLARIEHELTPLQRAAGRLVGRLSVLALGFCAVVAVSYGLLRADWTGGALAGVTVAISLIPEEFPMVLAIFMAIGAWRLATHRVLVRRNAVVETLGGASVLCVDKTGTLTENQMRVAELWTEGGVAAITPGAVLYDAAADLVQIAGLASAVRATDPMDKAIQALRSEMAIAGRPLGDGPERTWPLRPEMMAVTQLWRRSDGGWLAAAKGAPEAIFKLCGLDASEIERLHGVVHGFAARGLRVLGVASSRGEGAFAENLADARFRFDGLLGFLDPLRADVPAALAEAKAAGIAVVMITGDHPSTALAIAEAAGLDVAPGTMVGSELAALPFDVLCERLRRVRVFARIAPEQKLLIVEALKADGHVVVMTGDGVNDAPALETAHIGVAMGHRGTDVAREAADLVLLDDSFASIVGGVRLGRRIFANLRKALTFIVAVHLPIAGIALVPILMGLPPLLYPMHVVLLELAIDPLCALVFEGEPSEAAAMARPPRRRDEPLFGRVQLSTAVLQGLVVLLVVLGLYVVAVGRFPEPQARAAAFIALVFSNLALALANAVGGAGRLIAPHRWIFWGIVLANSALLAAALCVPALAGIFRMAAPPISLLAMALAVGSLAGGWWSLARWVGTRLQAPQLRR